MLWNLRKNILPNPKYYQEQISDFVHSISLLGIYVSVFKKKKINPGCLLYMRIAELS